MIFRKALHLEAGDIIDLAGQPFSVVSREIISDRYSESDNVKIIGQIPGSIVGEEQIILHKDDLVSVTVKPSVYTQPKPAPVNPAWARFTAGATK